MNPKKYIIRLIIYAIVTGLVVIITYLICELIKGDSILIMLVKGIVCFLISNLLYFIIYRNLEEYKEAKALAFKMLKIKR